MKQIESITTEQHIQKVLADEKKWMKDTMKLLRGNLTDEERFTYEMELARVGFEIGADEREEKMREEAGQKPIETEQRRKEIKQREADKEWMEQTMKLLRGNLTDEERCAYEIELARVGYMIGADERDERRRQEIEQQMEAAKQRIEAAEQKISAAVTNLIKEGSFSDEKIANLLNVSMEKVQGIKQDLKK